MSVCSELWLIITHQIPRNKFQKRIKNRNPCKNRNSLDYEIRNTQRFRSCDNHIPYRCLFSRKRTIINFAKLTPPVPIPSKVRKIIKILIFISLMGFFKSFYEGIKCLYRTFLRHQQEERNYKIYVNFYFNTNFWNALGGKG